MHPHALLVIFHRSLMAASIADSSASFVIRQAERRLGAAVVASIARGVACILAVSGRALGSRAMVHLSPWLPRRAGESGGLVTLGSVRSVLPARHRPAAVPS